MVFCFVFGLEPWLLPPALDMISVLTDKGHEVRVVYAEYQGRKPATSDYNTSLTFSVVPKQAGVKRLLTFSVLKTEVRKYLRAHKTDYLVACDILALQAVESIKSVKKGYWGFEIVNAPVKFKASLDFYRAIMFPTWVRSLNFYMAPSESRIQKVTDRVKKKMNNLVVYNCRKLVIGVRKPVEQNFQKKPAYKLIYSGMVSRSQYIEEIIDAMELLDKNITLDIAGPSNSDYQKMLAGKIAGNPALTNRVYLRGRLSREDAYALVASGDIGFVFYDEHSGSEAADPAPNKLSDYIAGNLWVVGSEQDYIKFWLETRGAGAIVSEIKKAAIADGIKRILTEPKFNDKTVLDNLYTTELNMTVQADKFLRFLETVR